MIYIFWSCRDLSEAKKIIGLLLEKRLIACASIIPQIESMYRWEGKIEESQEVKVILKTLEVRFQAISELIQAQSSYKVPEILQVSVTQGNASYLDWVAQEVR